MTAALKRDLAEEYGADFDRYWEREGRDIFEDVPDHIRLIDLQHARNLFSQMGMCGCGNPETGFDLVQGLLNLIAYHDYTTSEAVDLCGGDGPYHLIMGQLARVDVLDHGTSVYTCWLTKPMGVYMQQILSQVDWDHLDNDNATCTPHYTYLPDETPSYSVRECDEDCWKLDVPQDPGCRDRAAQPRARGRIEPVMLPGPRPSPVDRPCRCYQLPSGPWVHVRPGCPHGDR